MALLRRLFQYSPDTPLSSTTQSAYTYSLSSSLREMDNFCPPANRNISLSKIALALLHTTRPEEKKLLFMAKGTYVSHLG